MKLQSEEKIRKEEEKTRQEFLGDQGKGIIAVGQGEGIKKILEDMGADIIIDGGQSMNPSTNDFLEAIDKLNTMEVIILPNNKNVISAAKQAASLTDKKVVVIPTKSIPQAIASLMVYDEDLELDELEKLMTDEIDNVKTVELTRAVKDSKVNGMEIKAGNIIGLYNNDIRKIGNDFNEVVLELFKEVIKEEDLVTIYYGEDVEEKDALNLKSVIEENFDFEEVEIYSGNQPLYPYLISLE